MASEQGETVKCSECGTEFEVIVPQDEDFCAKCTERIEKQYKEDQEDMRHQMWLHHRAHQSKSERSKTKKIRIAIEYEETVDDQETFVALPVEGSVGAEAGGAGPRLTMHVGDSVDGRKFELSWYAIKRGATSGALAWHALTDAAAYAQEMIDRNVDRQYEVPFKKTTARAAGLSHAEIEVACRNVGIDLGCDACAALFYTGSTLVETHAPSCRRIS